MQHRAAAVLVAIGLGLAAWAGPAPAAETPVTTDVAGLWQGTSSGAERGPCSAMSFELRVEGGRIGGSAQSRTDDGARTEWAIFGLVDSAGRVTLETSHAIRPADRRLEHIVWAGRIEGGHMRVTQAGSAACPTARSLELTKK